MKQFFPIIFIHIGLMFPYSHNPIFEYIYHTTIYYTPPRNGFVKGFLLLLIKLFFDIPLDFSLSDKDRYRMSLNTQN